MARATTSYPWYSRVIKSAAFVGVVLVGVLAIKPRKPPQTPGAPPPPRLPAQMVGEWVQVYPAQGAFDRITLKADSSMSINGRGTGLPFDLDRPFHPTRWSIDTRTIAGSFCVAEAPPSRTGLCQMVRLVGDTLRIGNEKLTTLLRVREGTPLPSRAWSAPGLGGGRVPNGGSFRNVPPVVVRPDP